MTGSGVTSVAPADGFARKASGLVRSFSPTDALFYNILAINPFLVAQLSFTTMAVAFPGANLWLAVLICGMLCIPEALVYAQLTTLMPRSGGDYVFQSRILGGGAATFFAFSGIIIAEIAAILLVVSVGTGQIFSPFLTMLGAYYHSHALVSVATWLGGKTGFVVSGFVMLTWIALVNYRGLRVYGRRRGAGCRFRRHAVLIARRLRARPEQLHGSALRGQRCVPLDPSRLEAPRRLLLLRDDVRDGSRRVRIHLPGLGCHASRRDKACRRGKDQRLLDRRR
jgi:hypothetical protein